MIIQHLCSNVRSGGLTHLPPAVEINLLFHETLSPSAAY